MTTVPGSATDHERVRTLLSDLDCEFEADSPLGPLTWYGVGGRADWLVTPRSPAALQAILRRCRESGVPYRVMGSGANLLVADEGVRGITLRLTDSAFRQVSAIHRHRRNRGGDGQAGDGLRVMAGAQMERLVINMAMQGMAGLERMAGIPATLGGAVRMNAGGRFGAIAEVITAVGCLDLDGEPQTYGRSEIEFGYRRCSIIDPVILWAELRLTPEDPAAVHERVKEIFRFKKQTQPMGERSAGCVFKNPPAADATAASVPSGADEPGSGDRVEPERQSAGRLIDRCGLKGHAIGGAMVSAKHANFVVVRPGCTANDVLALIDHIVSTVRAQTGVTLERELVIWR